MVAGRKEGGPGGRIQMSVSVTADILCDTVFSEEFWDIRKADEDIVRKEEIV